LNFALQNKAIVLAQASADFWKMRSNQIFPKRELVDTLGRDLARARKKRDMLASSVTTLTAQIAELESRLAAENARKTRERAASVPLALASACSTLGLRVGEDPAAARVAETVIRFAQRGIRDPMELRRMTLKQFGFYE
jgi:outer membrane murein-binding lipoprotein Lpp